MSTNNKPKRLVAQEWSELFEKHKTSGMTIKAFCEQEGVGWQSFYLWRKKLQNPAEGGKKEKPFKQVKAFVPIRVSSDLVNRSDKSLQIQVDLRNGRTVRFERYIENNQQLTEFLQLIEGAI